MAKLSNAEELVERVCYAYEGQCPAPTLSLKRRLCARGVWKSEPLEGHEYTRVECSVILQESKDSNKWKCTWRIQRRVCAVREDLHAVVKKALGETKYEELFHPDYPFVRQGGLNVPFNSWRLGEWLLRLGEIISQRELEAGDLRVILTNLVKPSFTDDELAALEGKPWCTEEKAVDEQLGQWTYVEDLFNSPGPTKHPGYPPFPASQRVPRQLSSAQGYASAAVMARPSESQDVPVIDVSAKTEKPSTAAGYPTGH
mmetsp:Transcript_104408/g.185662  ORF Transcript_104408/g.185662 Transcript_104408/m.185662 type:complete len:257 (+) Transcript_104408:52-822(+)